MLGFSYSTSQQIDWWARTRLTCRWNKHLCLDTFEVWWVLDWYMSTLRRTNVYALNDLKFDGPWTDTSRPSKEQTAMPWQAWRLVDCGLVWRTISHVLSYALTIQIVQLRLIVQITWALSIECLAQLDRLGHMSSTFNV